MWNAVAVMVLALSHAGAAQMVVERSGADITIRVHAEAEDVAAWLPTAQALVDRIFAELSLSVSWVDCVSEVNSMCDRAPAGAEFVIRLRRQRTDRASHGCGVSLRPHAAPGHYITLFVDCIRAASDTLGTPESVLGAYTIAHEIGHLLLPVGHASRGIMRARPDRLDWARAERGGLRFQPSEVQQIRSALQRRTPAGTPMRH